MTIRITYIYKNEIFRNQNTKFRFRHGFLEVYEMYLNSDTSDLNAKFMVDISEIIPRFNLSISGNKLHYETPQTNFVNKDGAVSETKSRNFFDQIYGLPSISKVKSCKFGIKAAVSTGNSSLSGDLLQEVPCPMSDFCVVKIIIILRNENLVRDKSKAAEYTA